MKEIYNISILRIINSKNIDIDNSNNGKEYSVIRFNGVHYELVSNSVNYTELVKNKVDMIPVRIENDELEQTVKQLIYKVQKEILNPMETAFLYQEICTFTNIKQKFLSSKINKTQGAISNKLRLLKLPTYIQNEIIKGNLKERHGRALLQIKGNLNDNNIVKNLVLKTIENNWKVSKLEEEINLVLNKKIKPNNKMKLTKLESKRSLKNREALLSINQLEKDIENSIGIINKNLPNTVIDIQKGINDDDYVINIVLKDVNKEI